MLMFRTRLRLAAAAAGLALTVGCMNLGDGRLMSRIRCRNATAMPCCTEAPPCCDGMLMGDMGPYLVAPGGPAVMETPLGAPAPLTQPPAGQRLVPQPQPQAQPTPFNPNAPRMSLRRN
jgi:hypothetical protein